MPCVAQDLQSWGMGGSTAAHWDGMMEWVGTWADLGDTLKVPVHLQSSETLCILQL